MKKVFPLNIKIGQILGIISILNDNGGSISLQELSDESFLQADDLVNIIDACKILGLLSVKGEKIKLKRKLAKRNQHEITALISEKIVKIEPFSRIIKDIKFNGDALGILFVIFIPAIIGYLFSIINIYAGIGIAIILFLIFLAAAIRVVNQWNRKAVLSFGKYIGIMGPGIHIIIPFVQTTPITLDLRVINTIFKAEKTLTKDNVPVDVDALLFWKVVNSENAVLNVQIYWDSVQLAAQTALRDVIGKTELSEMLAGRDVIGKDVKNLIEDRVNDWGIEAISVEIRDVSIPPDLQDAMARVAVADREKQARGKLAESESLAADKMIEASEKIVKIEPFSRIIKDIKFNGKISTTELFHDLVNKGLINYRDNILGIEEFKKNLLVIGIRLKILSYNHEEDIWKVHKE